MKEYHAERAARAKINWFLDIVGQRTDGYHELSSLMQKISLADRLSLTVSAGKQPEPWAEEGYSCGIFEHANMRLRLGLKSAEGLAVDEKNTCVLSFVRFVDFWSRTQRSLPAERTFTLLIDKKIPVQGGLGGGSADAAGFLRLLNDYSAAIGAKALPEDQLQKIALSVGADVPFCLDQRDILYCRGVGEIFTEVGRPARALPLLLLLPALQVSTGEAFRAYDAMNREDRALMPQSRPEVFVKSLLEGDYSALQADGQNSFFFLHEKNKPEIAEFRRLLLEAGASYAALSGSGPSFFALFESEQAQLAALAELEKRRQEGPGQACILPVWAGKAP